MDGNRSCREDDHSPRVRYSTVPATSPLSFRIMTATPSLIREYDISARSTSTFGRVLCSARTHHFIVDGPVQNGCPGEEVTPPEAFLASIAACGVELVHVIA